MLSLAVGWEIYRHFGSLREMLGYVHEKILDSQ